MRAFLVGHGAHPVSPRNNRLEQRGLAGPSHVELWSQRRHEILPGTDNIFLNPRHAVSSCTNSHTTCGGHARAVRTNRTGIRSVASCITETWWWRKVKGSKCARFAEQMPRLRLAMLQAGEYGVNLRAGHWSQVVVRAGEWGMRPHRRTIRASFSQRAIWSSASLPVSV